MRKIFLPPELYMGIENLDNETKGKLFDLVYRYNLGLEYKILPELKIIFGFFKPFFDNDVLVYEGFCEKQSKNGKLGGRPKASIAELTNKGSDKPKKAKEPKKAIEVKGSDIYTKEYIYSNINIDKYKEEFKNKNIEIEFEKFWNYWEGSGKKIKKPNQAFKNWLLPKKWDKEYIEGMVDKDDDQRIKEFLNGKQKFWDKYGEDKYYEIKDKWISKCLAQPLSL